MEELKMIFAENLTALRTAAKMTQAELAEKLNYSDKSISKWERGEGLPDLLVLKKISEIFGVSADWMLYKHDGKIASHKIAKKLHRFSKKTLIATVFMGIWTLAVLLFVIFWLMGSLVWEIPLVCLPVSLACLLILYSAWGIYRYNKVLTMGIIAGAFLLVYYYLRSIEPWQLIFVLIMAELLVVMCYKIRYKKPVLAKEDETDIK